MGEAVPEHDDDAPRPWVVPAIAAGGILGVLARYGVGRLIHVTPATFPWATFWVNVSGALVLGFVIVVIVERFPASTHLRPFVAIGFLGAYTTFSALAIEAVLLVRDGRSGIAVAYVTASCVVGLLAAFMGITVAVRLVRRPRSHSC